ncbi:hypothetical protein ACQCU1_02750 [Sutcliffiella horikoshii]|uniref:hypothetical protein n=1 Tax=Sutcliffiella horikoshii TaxID=79883 RepID=UPI003CF6BB8F
MKVVDTLKPIRDEDTGYVTGYEKDSVDRVLEQQEREQKQRKAYRDMKEQEESRLKDQRHFYKVFDSGKELVKETELADLGVLFRLTTNLYYEGTGILAKEKSKEGSLKPLKRSDLMKLLTKSKNGVDAAIERLERIGAIRIDRGRRPIKYYISEDLVSFGKGTGEGHFTKLYKTKAQLLLKKLTDSEAGVVFKCLPYIHYKTHLLVMSPYEKDLTKVNAIRGAALAEQLGIERKSFNNLTSQLKRKGAMMFLEVGTKGKGYVINPDLCDRGFTSEYTDRVRAYFTSLLEEK